MAFIVEYSRIVCWAKSNGNGIEEAGGCFLRYFDRLMIMNDKRRELSPAQVENTGGCHKIYVSSIAVQ